MVALVDELRGRGLDLELERIFYKHNDKGSAKGLTKEGFRAAFVDRFGEQGVASLEAQGLLKTFAYA